MKATRKSLSLFSFNLNIFYNEFYFRYSNLRRFLLAQKILFLMLAGAFGTLFRYLLSSSIQKFTGSEFPMGTLTVNILGCFVVGLLYALLEGKISVSEETRLILFVGFMGAFTTFSTFLFESNMLIKNSQYLFAFGNIMLQNVIGLVAVYGGMQLGKIAS